MEDEDDDGRWQWGGGSWQMTNGKRQMANLFYLNNAGEGLSLSGISVS